jgi:bifunctional DNA-binding transcriptional regulator/antitoxin component of YhaV-PrlF toxin-antitoxin module
MNNMTEIIVDDKYKIHFTKQLINLLKIKPRDRFNIHVEAGKKIVLEKIENKKDSLLEALESPAHVEPAKIKQLNLNALEEELWTT